MVLLPFSMVDSPVHCAARLVPLLPGASASQGLCACACCCPTEEGRGFLLGGGCGGFGVSFGFDLGGLDGALSFGDEVVRAEMQVALVQVVMVVERRVAHRYHDCVVADVVLHYAIRTRRDRLAVVALALPNSVSCGTLKSG